MPDIDLEPRNYRRRGKSKWQPPKPYTARSKVHWLLYRRWFQTIGILCGIWMGSVIGVARYMLYPAPLWPVVFVSTTPLAIWGLIVLLAD